MPCADRNYVDAARKKWLLLWPFYTPPAYLEVSEPRKGEAWGKTSTPV